MRPQPPCRTTHLSPDTGIVYDRWDGTGRPVLLLHPLLLDRTLWWPVAAELAGTCAVIAPDLPGHGDTPPATDCSPGRITESLAGLLHRLELGRAPVVVAHSTSGAVADEFAAQYAVHAVLVLDEPAGTGCPGIDAAVAAAGVEYVPEQYRPFAQPRRDPLLLDIYRAWLGRPAGRRVPHARHGTPVNGCTPLTDPEGVAAQISSLL
jgi:pimeloyl-ACP methyl ester carboxylesterase